jgi:hypothetical protein
MMAIQRADELLNDSAGLSHGVVRCADAHVQYRPKIRDGVSRAGHAAARGKQQAEIFREVEVAARVQQGVGRLVGSQCVLAEQFHAERPAPIECVLRQRTPEARVVHARRGVDDEAATAVEGPRANAFLQPQRQPVPGAPVAEAASRAARRQFRHRERTDLQSAIVHTHEAILDAQFDIADAGRGGAMVRHVPGVRQYEVELRIRCDAAVVFDRGAADCAGTVDVIERAEHVELVVPKLHRLGIVGEEWRAGEAWRDTGAEGAGRHYAAGEQSSHDRSRAKPHPTR